MEQILKHSKYIDPMIDVAFKQIFGKEKNKRLIKELLEHVFHQDITELEFVNVEHPGESKDDRKAVFDLQCKSRQIGDFIVEVQVKEQKHFDKRAIYYSTFPITAQAPRGDWNYDFKPVFFLGLLNFGLPDATGKDEGFVHRYSIRNDRNGMQLTDALQFVFMEVGRFDKPLNECNSFEDKFLYYFKNLPNFAMKPETQNDGYFEQLLEAAEYSNMTKAEREAYNRRLKIQRDNYAADEFAREKAEREIAEGRARGLEEGRAEGRTEGRAEGESAKARDVAKGLIREGVSIDIIQRVTGLSAEEITDLNDQFK